MSPNRLYRLSLVVAFALLMVSGCGKTQNSQFYMLTAIPKVGNQPPTKPLPDDVIVGIADVQLPAHLDRPQIISRISPNELRLSEFHRWAEPLKDNATQVVAANLRSLLGTDQVTVAPRLGGLEVNYGVHVEILRLDGVPGDEATLEARWSIVARNAEQSASPTREARYTETVSESTYDELVRAESSLLLSLSRDIAAAILNMHNHTAGAS